MSNSIVVLIPAYNEALEIGQVVCRARQHAPVLLVDDGSTDDTPRLAEKAGAEVLRYAPNRGKGVALRRGFAHALTSGYEAVITLDGDGQHDPAEIPRFMARYEPGAGQLVIGQRRFEAMPLRRRLANMVGTWILNWAVGQTIPDSMSGFRLLDRNLMQGLLNGKESGFLFELEMIITCLEDGYALKWVPISTIYGAENSHIHSLSHLWASLNLALEARQRLRMSPSQGN